MRTRVWNSIVATEITRMQQPLTMHLDINLFVATAFLYRLPTVDRSKRCPAAVTTIATFHDIHYMIVLARKRSNSKFILQCCIYNIRNSLSIDSFQVDTSKLHLNYSWGFSIIPNPLIERPRDNIDFINKRTSAHLTLQIDRPAEYLSGDVLRTSSGAHA